jgi:hypothetical protein
MGLFSFLFGGKKKAKAAAGAAAPVVAVKPATAAAVIVAAEPVEAAAGVVQAKLRLRLAASLRSGAHAAAYEAAQGLADIQTKAGRKTAARIWSEQAERIKASLAA